MPIFCLFTNSRDISLLITFYNSAYQISLKATNYYSATIYQPSWWFCQKRGRDKHISWTTSSMKIKTWLKWNLQLVPPLDPASESNRWKSKKKLKDLNNCSTLYNNCHNQKKTNYKKLFSEDLYYNFFSCFSNRYVCTQTHFISHLCTMAGH